MSVPSYKAKYWSFLSTIGVLSFLAIKFGSFESVLPDLISFWNFQPTAIEPVKYSNLLEIAPNLLIQLLLVLFLVTFCGIVFSSPQKGRHSLDIYTDISKRYNTSFKFAYISFVVLCEELFARYLFLDILRQTFQSNFELVVLIFIGNSIWSLVHLLNFESKEDRTISKVIPQYVMGLMTSIVFLQYGFWIGYVFHMTYNSILMSTMKLHNTTVVDYIFIVISGLYCGIGYFIIGDKFTDIYFWFNLDTVKFSIEGWSTIDYIGLILFSSGALSFLLNAALYDREIPILKKGENIFVELTKNFFYVIVGALLIILPYKLMNHYGFEGVVWVYLVVYLIIALNPNQTLSIVSRNVWLGLTQTLITCLCVLSLGLWQAIITLGALYLMRLPYFFLRYFDT